MTYGPKYHFMGVSCFEVVRQRKENLHPEQSHDYPSFNVYFRVLLTDIRMCFINTGVPTIIRVHEWSKNRWQFEQIWLRKHVIFRSAISLNYTRCRFVNKIARSTYILAFIRARFGTRLSLGNDLWVVHMSEVRYLGFEIAAIFSRLLVKLLAHLSFQRKLKTKEEQREKNTGWRVPSPP